MAERPSSQSLRWLVLDEVRQHFYDIRAKGERPDDPGWHCCRCGWQGYWCDYEPHVAERITDALIESPFVTPDLRRSTRCKDVCVKEFGPESCDAFGQPCLDVKDPSHA